MARVRAPEPPKPSPKRAPRTGPRGGHDANQLRLAKAVEHVAAGMFPHRAWVLAGGSHETWGKWRLKAAAGIEPYATYVRTVEEASARFEQRLSSTVVKLAFDKKDAKTLFEILKSRFGKDWNRQHVDITTDEELDDVLRIVAEECGAEKAERVAERLVDERGRLGQGGGPLPGAEAEDPGGGARGG